MYKQNFLGLKWVIITKNNNKFVKYINQKKGFIKASDLSTRRAENVFNI